MAKETLENVNQQKGFGNIIQSVYKYLKDNNILLGTWKNPIFNTRKARLPTAYYDKHSVVGASGLATAKPFISFKNNNTNKVIRLMTFNATVKNLGVDISDAIIAERKSAGPFTSFENFIRRITHKNLNKKSLEALTMCGALDHFGERNEILANIESVLEFHKHVVKDNILQNSLFATTEDSSFVMKKVPAASQKQKLTWEKELLGLFVSGFPLDPWKEKIAARNIDIEKVHSHTADGKEVSLAVIIEAIKITITKKGDKMALLTLRDYSGFIEVAVFPESYKKYKDLVVIDTPLVIRGKVSTRNGEKTIALDEIKKLEVA
jgi:DNA polymerase-3 subunit alpha